MKIMFVTPWYPDEERPNSGIFIRAQAQALAKEHQVLVVAVKVNYGKRSLYSFNVTETIGPNLAEYRLEVIQSLPVYNQFNYLFIAAAFAKKKAKEFQPDVVHASIGYPGAILGWRIAKKMNIPFVFTEHTRPTNNFRSPWHKFLTRFAVRRAAAVMAVGNRLALEMKQAFNVEVEIVPNIVDVEKYKRVAGTAQNIWQLGFIGGMNTPVKGLDILLQAVSQLNTPFHLHICGAGTLMDAYKKNADDLKISDRCTFYGFVNPAEMPDFFSRIHTLVCSSRYETFNISLIEAMASGLPVVSTRCGGPEDFVNESNGVLCDVADSSQLKDAIVRVMQHRELYDSAALRTFASGFEPGVVSRKITGVYESAIAGFSPARPAQVPEA